MFRRLIEIRILIPSKDFDGDGLDVQMKPETFASQEPWAPIDEELFPFVVIPSPFYNKIQAKVDELGPEVRRKLQEAGAFLILPKKDYIRVTEFFESRKPAEKTVPAKEGNDKDPSTSATNGSQGNPS